MEDRRLRPGDTASAPKGLIMEAIDLKSRRLLPRLEGSLLTVGLLIVALLSVAISLKEVIRGFDEWGLILPSLAIGLFAGWFSARGGLPSWSAILVIITVGMLYTLSNVGDLGGKILQIASEVPALTPKALIWSGEDSSPLTELVRDSFDLVMDMGVLLDRAKDWAVASISDRGLYDPIAIGLVWSLILWLVSAWSGWFAGKRRDPLLAMLPAGALLVTSLTLVQGEMQSLLLFLGVTLLLTASMRHIERRERWEITGMDYPHDLGTEIGLTAFVAAVALVLLAWLSSSFSLTDIVTYIEERTRRSSSSSQGFASSMDGQSGVGEVGDSFREVQVPGLPREHLLGSGPELSREIVMVVRIENLSRLQEEINLPYYYWRSLTYDVYTGHGWRSSTTSEVTYEPGGLSLSSINPHQQWIRQDVRMLDETGDLLYAAGEPATADTEFTIAWRGEEDIFGAKVEKDAYRVDSLVVEVDGETLVGGGTVYPGWIIDRYLQLPESTPTRIFTLARELTATEPTPYDRVIAIENYLRGIPYSLDVPKPPSYRDVVDYFLFDLQKGYCDYFATAMVVLSRAAGIPARLAIGYVGGVFSEEEGAYVVTEAEAHSWAEIFFPEIGWVTFEPTAGRAPLDRTTEPALLLPIEMDRSPLLPHAEFGDVWLSVLMGIIAVGGCGVLIIGWVNRRKLYRQSPSTVVVLLYQRMRSHTMSLSVARHPGDTPYEFSASLVSYLTSLMRRGYWASWLKGMAGDVGRLAQLVVWEQFSPHSGGHQAREQAIRIWRRLRVRFWLVRIYSWFLTRKR
jgi:transglutaminase-like putative cysteine protease